MNTKFFAAILLLTLVLVAKSASPDFGSFSGNSDYAGSREYSNNSPASDRNPSRTSRENSMPSHNSGSNFGILPIAGSLSSRSGNSNIDDDECMGILFVIAVVFIFVMWNRSKAKSRQIQRNIVITNVQPTHDIRPMNEYLTLDPEFNADKIKSLMANLYVQMQDSWTNKNIESLRPYMTDEFFSRMDRQLDSFRKTGRTDYTERIAVLDVTLKGFKQSGGMDYIIVGLKSRIVSYVLEDRTGKLISGDMNREKFMQYEIELSRKSGTITQLEDNSPKSITCPHCGAPLKLNASAKCEYCGSIITNVNTNWAISEMRGISQQTV